MKRWIICLMLMLASFEAWPQGELPFFVNYFPTDYGAHARNFDVVSDAKGRVYVANFEGLLYSDQSGWHTLHAPGIFRITKLYKDKTGRIWVGGYNLFGYLEASPKNGTLQLKLIFSQNNKGFIGEVTDIREQEGRIHVATSIGDVSIEDDSMNDFVVEPSQEHLPHHYKGTPINQQLTLSDSTTLLATAGKGLILLDQEGNEIYALTEQNGLCNNNINRIYADQEGYVWGATDNGLFLLNVNHIYTRFGATEGLPGEVQSICHTEKHLYVGTLQGVYAKEGKKFHLIGNINYACWQLQPDGKGNIYASTAGGIFRIGEHRIEQLSTAHTLSCFINPDGSCYTGEVDGIYLVAPGRHQLMNQVEKATCFFEDRKGTLLVRNIYGQIFRLSENKEKYIFVIPVNAQGEEARYNNTLYRQGDVLYVQSHAGIFRWDENSQTLLEQPEMARLIRVAQYPQLIYPEDNSHLWITDNEGKSLHIYNTTSANRQDERNALLYPIHNLSILALDIDKKDVWLGGNFGLIRWLSDKQEPDRNKVNHVYIRRIVLNRDSVLWGGFCGGDRLDVDVPMQRYDFDSNSRDICINFSTDAFSTLGDVEYRYRFNNNSTWSAWSTETSAHYVNPRPGNYTFEVMARDRYGRETEPVSLTLYVHYPFFLKWYCIVGYILLLGIFIALIVKWRMRRLLAEKMRLEQVVEERTSQIRSQKDEIEQKSKKLEVALDDLNKAQFQLIRQEKMATVGALTKGLVDRILNPMNYVNNFSHMSQGLVKDVRGNLEEDKERITPDIYDDSMDVLNMLEANLKKIEEHGLNTTRILKAMEEMLKKRNSVFQPMDIAAICRKNIEMLHNYYAKEIAACHIQVEGPGQEEVIVAEIDTEQFSRTVMSILANSVYALQKKYQRFPFEALVRLTVGLNETKDVAEVRVYDNGTGIEKSIIDKVFDPFFTTKTTTEATGVGMYLSKEMIQNHGGDITVRSEKDQYTEFTISVPIHHPEKENRTENQLNEKTQ